MTQNIKTADPKTRILAAAVQLFASKGVENVSLRELTTLAEVNIAAVNYHFGSKLGLEEAVFEDVAARANQKRLAALRAVLQAASKSGTLPQTVDILETFIEPYLSDDVGSEGRLLAQLILKHRIAPSGLTRRLIKSHFDPMAKAYVKALTVANPSIDASEFVWRYMFMTCTVVLTVTDTQEENRVRALSAGKLNACNVSALRQALLRFLVAGLTSPNPKDE